MKREWKKTKLGTFALMTLGGGIVISIVAILGLLVVGVLLFLFQGPQGVAEMISHFEESVSRDPSVLLFPFAISAIYGAIGAAQNITWE